MAEWIDGSFEGTLTTAQTADGAVELWQNNDTPNHDRTIVDGFVTIMVNTDALHDVTLYAPAPNFAVAADFTFADPSRNEPIVWYRFGCAAGPLVYRIKSQRTLGAKEEVWAMTRQLRGSISSVVRVQWQFLISN